jgi:predicted transcriptional regulator
MEQLVDQFAKKISELQTENDRLGLRLTKNEILSTERLVRITELESTNGELEKRVDELVTEKFSLTRERDDGMVVAENLLARISEMKTDISRIDELNERMEIQERVNRDLQTALGDRVTVRPPRLPDVPIIRSLHASVGYQSSQTETILTLNKYTQTIEKISIRE